MPVRLLFVGFVPVLILSACSSLPDAANPVEWGKKVADWAFEEETPEAADKSKAPIPGEDQDFPTLNQSFSRPEVSDPQDRRLIAEGLLADRANAGYTDPVRRQNVGSVSYRASAGEAPTPPQRPQPAPPTVAPAATVVPMSSLPPRRAATPERVQLVEGLTKDLTQGLTEGLTASAQLSPAPVPDPAPAVRAQAVMPSETVRPATGPVVTPRPVDGGSVVIDELQLATLGMESETLSLGGVDTPVSAPAHRAALEDRVGLSAGVQPLVRYRPFGASRSYLVAQIQFADGASGLSAQDHAILNQVAALVSERGGSLRVIGHASSRTRNLDLPQHVEANFRISEDRAVAVARYLRDAGVPANTIFAGAVGAADPRYYNGTPAGEAGNRRVEIFIDY